MKNVLITGGATGLGKSLVREFYNRGYNVIACFNNSLDNALKLKEELHIEIVKCDISNEVEVKQLFNKYDIDILINNASISLDNDILSKNKDEFMNVLSVNLVGTFLMSKEAVKNNVKDIINISSTDSLDTYQELNIDYSSSKAGVNILTKTFALSFKDVRTIGVLPNWIDTESVLSMNKEYLKNELDRIGQKNLLKKELVAKKIFEIYDDKNIKSGDLIRIDEGDLNE